MPHRFFLIALAALAAVSLAGFMQARWENARLRAALEALSPPPGVASASDVAYGAESADQPEASLSEQGLGTSAAASTLVSPPAWRRESIGRLLNNPEARQVWIDARKAGLDRAYAPFFRQLGLDEDRLDLLRELMAEQQAARAAAATLGRNGRDPAAQAAAEAWDRQAEDNVDRSIADLIGPRGLDWLDAYEQTLPERSMVEDFSHRLHALGLDLPESQVEALIVEFAEERAESPLSRDLSRLSPGEWRTVDQSDVDRYLAERRERDQRLLFRAQGLLSNEQIEALADVQIRDREAVERRLRLMLRGP
jgi:hypothetical protein